MDVALPNMERVSPVAGTGRPLHAELRLNLLASATIDSLAKSPHPVASLVPEAVAITPQSPFMVIAPGAGSPIRVWAVERLAAVSRTLIERDNLDAVLIGAAADTAACEFIASRLPAGRVYNLAGGTPLSDLPALIQKARLFVGYNLGTKSFGCLSRRPDSHSDGRHRHARRLASQWQKGSCTGNGDWLRRLLSEHCRRMPLQCAMPRRNFHRTCIGRLRDGSRSAAKLIASSCWDHAATVPGPSSVPHPVANPDGRVWLSFHTSFENPLAQGAPLREGIEVRSLVFFPQRA